MTDDRYTELYEWIAMRIDELGIRLTMHGMGHLAAELQDEFRWEFEAPVDVDLEVEADVVEDDDDDWQPEDVIDLTEDSDDDSVKVLSTPPRQVRRNQPSTPSAPIKIR